MVALYGEYSFHSVPLHKWLILIVKIT